MRPRATNRTLSEESDVATTQSNGEPTRTLNSVVFVDIVGSTELAAALGDEEWAVLLEQYQAVVRVALTNAGGEEMDMAGDGVFAVFADPASAVAFGCFTGRIVEPLGLRVRVGVHTGTCWVAGEKCSGLRSVSAPASRPTPSPTRFSSRLRSGSS
jgi:class 3 adenylate cyclase